MTGSFRFPYPDGVIVALLRAGLSGVTVETSQAPDLADRVPYIAVHLSDGGIVSDQLLNAALTLDVWASPSKRAAWSVVSQALGVLSDAWTNQTSTPDGYIRYINMTGDMPKELPLAGQPADLFHYSWSTDVGIRPAP